MNNTEDRDKLLETIQETFYCDIYCSVEGCFVYDSFEGRKEYAVNKFHEKGWTVLGEEAICPTHSKTTK